MQPIQKIRTITALPGALFFLLFAFTPTTSFASSTVDVRLVRHNIIVVPVSVNGEGPFDFMLDTGTTTSIVGEELARRLELQRVDRSLVTSAAGTTPVPRAQLRRLQMGPKTLLGMKVLCLDIETLQKLDKNIQGVLGQDFLSRFNFLLSYEKKQIEFEVGRQLARSVTGPCIKYEPIGRRVLIPVYNRNEMEAAGSLVLDTGAMGVVLFQPTSRKLALDLRLDRLGPTELASFKNRIRAHSGRARHLRVGDRQLRNTPVTVVAAKDAIEGRTEVGLLPGNLFQSVYFNHSENYVVLDPRFTTTKTARVSATVN
jgi:predicted aspartyl protease